MLVFSSNSIKKNQKAPDIIVKSLEKLHELAIKKDKRVILFLDEFQVLGEVINNNSIEAVIREAAQKSTHVSYLFSGSNRHLMEQMFYDRKRPFYKLCDQIKLERIHEKEYEQYINSAAKETWDTTLEHSTLAKIFELSESHSYYVNKLCSLLWQESKVPAQKSSRPKTSISKDHGYISMKINHIEF